jgi:hypothetical protein
MGVTDHGPDVTASLGRVPRCERPGADQRLGSGHGESGRPGPGEILRRPRLAGSEGAYPLSHRAGGRRIMAPVGHVGQTVGGKIVDGLAGYREYTLRVPYKLIPYVW